MRKLKYALPLAALVMALTATATTAKPTAAGTPIKIAILSDCKGAFAAFYGADVGGAIQAFVEQTGAKVVNKNDPIKGMKGGSIAGHPIAGRHRLLERLTRHQRLSGRWRSSVRTSPSAAVRDFDRRRGAKAHPEEDVRQRHRRRARHDRIVRAPNSSAGTATARGDAGTGWVAYNVLAGARST